MELVELIDEHADTAQLLVAAHLAIDGVDEPVPPLLASEAARCVCLRSLISLDNALEGDPLHAGYSANVMPAPLTSEAELIQLVKQIYPKGDGARAAAQHAHAHQHARTSCMRTPPARSLPPRLPSALTNPLA